MPALILYLLKVNAALLLFYMAYHVALRRLTLYHLNRLFLVFGIVFSTLYPLIDLTQLFGQHQQLASTYIATVPAWVAVTALPAHTPAFSYWQIPVFLFWAGTAAMAARLLLQFVSLYRLHAASAPAAHKGVFFRQVQGITQAFSFWQTIYLNTEQHKQEELESILRHEQIHVEGWHTLDVLLAELSAVFYWFNPGTWLMKKAIKENLEFIADQNVVSAGVDKKEYQYLLLRVSGAPEPHIANQFSFPSLKRRIVMMNKPPTKRANQLRLLVVLPIVAVLLVAFRNASQEVAVHNKVTAIQPLSGPGEQTEVQSQDTTHFPEDYKNFLKRNPAVSDVSWISSDTDKVVVYLKSGSAEMYDLNDSNQLAAAKSKYGVLPAQPAPPTPAQEELPPPPAAAEDLPAPPPRRQQPIFIPDNDAYYKNNLPEDYKAFLRRHPSVKQVGWKFDGNKDWNLESVIIYLKSGKEEEYDFEGKRRIPAAEEKYGPLPALPAPPPPVPANEELPPPPPPVQHDPLYIPEASNQPADYTAFLKRNPAVKQVGWTGKKMNRVIIYLNSGETDIHDLSDSKSVAAAENKYGKLPTPPLPPPPPPARGENK